eukprot:1158547-Pelagomonas_calceolata.AAC.7
MPMKMKLQVRIGHGIGLKFSWARTHTHTPVVDPVEVEQGMEVLNRVREEETECFFMDRCLNYDPKPTYE